MAAPGKDATFDHAVRGALLATTCPLSFWDIVARRDAEDMLPAVVGPGLLRMAAPYLAGAAVLVVGWLYVTSLQRARDSALAGQAATMQALSVEAATRQAVTDALVRSEAAQAERQAVRQRDAVRLNTERGKLNATLTRAPDWATGRLPADVYHGLRAAAGSADDGGDAEAAGEPAR